MARKQNVDAIGAVFLVGFALHLAFNQVVVKVTNGGFEPVFLAALRSCGAAVILLLWMRLRGISISLPRSSMFGGILSGLFFAFEFMALFVALDLTTVSRASIIFYSMPVWLTISAHFLLPGEQMDRGKVLGLILAMVGVAVAVADRGGGTASLAGDLLALAAAMLWAGIVLCVRATPLSAVAPAQQLLWQLIISAPVLMICAMFVGEYVRELEPIHLWGLAFQIVAVASLGFLFWFWLMSIYPAASVASFSFLSPVFSVMLGWLILNEEVGLSIWMALALVAAGIFLINAPRKARVPGH